MWIATTVGGGVPTIDPQLGRNLFLAWVVVVLVVAVVNFRALRARSVLGRSYTPAPMWLAYGLPILALLALLDNPEVELWRVVLRVFVAWKVGTWIVYFLFHWLPNKIDRKLGETEAGQQARWATAPGSDDMRAIVNAAAGGDERSLVALRDILSMDRPPPEWEKILLDAFRYSEHIEPNAEVVMLRYLADRQSDFEELDERALKLMRQYPVPATVRLVAHVAKHTEGERRRRLLLAALPAYRNLSFSEKFFGEPDRELKRMMREAQRLERQPAS